MKKKIYRISIAIFILLLYDGIIGHFFPKVVDILHLNDETSLYYYEVHNNGLEPAILNIILHWLPRVLLIGIGTIFFLKLLNVDWKDVLTFKSFNNFNIYLFSVLFVSLFQIAVVMFVKHKSMTLSQSFSDNPISFLCLYAMRFLPSAFAEELVYRGGIFTAIHKNSNLIIAGIVNIVLFSLGHLYGNFWLFINSIILGIIFTIVYYKTKNLLLTVALHTFNNIIYAMLNY